MAKKIPKDAALIIHQFMIDDMGLSGVALLVYALIYSFSRQRKIYYGTREYLSKRTGASVSAVDRALTKLCSLGFIRKIKGSENTNSLYAPTDKKSYILKRKTSLRERLTRALLVSVLSVTSRRFASERSVF